MTQKIKLSEVQLHALRKIGEGWEGCSYSGWGSSSWLQKDGCGCGGDTEKVSRATLWSLYKKGLLKTADKYEIDRTRFRLSKKGKEFMETERW